MFEIRMRFHMFKPNNKNIVLSWKDPSMTQRLLRSNRRMFFFTLIILSARSYWASVITYKITMLSGLQMEAFTIRKEINFDQHLFKKNLEVVYFEKFMHTYITHT